MFPYRTDSPITRAHQSPSSCSLCWGQTAVAAVAACGEAQIDGSAIARSSSSIASKSDEEDANEDDGEDDKDEEDEENEEGEEEDELSSATSASAFLREMKSEILAACLYVSDEPLVGYARHNGSQFRRARSSELDRRRDLGWRPAQTLVC
jgi:hypothetical protein